MVIVNTCWKLFRISNARNHELAPANRGVANAQVRCGVQEVKRK